MEYLKIKNWEKYQHYSKRNPPWIKLHNKLFDNYEYGRLQNDSKLLLISLYLLASKCDNCIPNDVEWIKKKTMIQGKIEIVPLIKAGFININSGVPSCDQNDSEVIATCKQNGGTETETETETKTETKKNRKEYSVNFLSFWNEYPVKKAKGDAHKSWQKLKPDINVVLLAIKNQVKEKEKLRSNKLFCPEWPNPATWLNQLRWEDEDYEITEDDDGLTRFLQRHQDAG